MKITTSKKFESYMLDKYPELKTNASYKRMFNYLCFGVPASGKGQLTVSRKTCAMMERKVKELMNNRYASLPFLQAFKKDVLPNFEWSDYRASSFGDGECRVVVNDGLDQEDYKIIRKELTEGKEEVIFTTGKKANEKNILESRKNSDLAYAYLCEKEEFYFNETQQLIYDELQSVSMSGKAFKFKWNENYQHACNVASNIKYEDDKEVVVKNSKKMLPKSAADKLADQQKILLSIGTEPRIFYAPSLKQNSPRIYHSNTCVLSLKSEIRKAFCRGWVEADLVSSQFVILSSILKAKKCQEFINSGENIWIYLNEACGNHGKPEKALKKVFKEIIYGIAFGKSETFHLEKINGVDVRPLDKICKEHNIEALLSNELIRELLDKRKEWFDQINKDGYICDVWGRRQYMTPSKYGWKNGVKVLKEKGRRANAVAASAIQSIEMEIISAAFQCQREIGKLYDWQIMLFQHDGFTVSFNNKLKQQFVQKRLQQEIANKANDVGAKLGIDLSAMKLEFVEL